MAPEEEMRLSIRESVIALRHGRLEIFRIVKKEDFAHMLSEEEFGKLMTKTLGTRALSINERCQIAHAVLDLSLKLKEKANGNGRMTSSDAQAILGFSQLLYQLGLASY